MRNKSRQQASIEFIIIMAAVTAFSVFGLSYYMHLHSAINQITGASNSILLPANGTNASTPLEMTAYALVPYHATAQAESQATLIISTTEPAMLSVSAGSPNSIISPCNYSNQNLTSFLVLPVEVYIPSAGNGTLWFNVTAFSGNSELSKHLSYSFTSYANTTRNSTFNSSRQGTLNPQNVTAKIIPISEYVYYNASKFSNAYRITETSHCSYLNFWGQQMPIQSQCGGASWYFWSFSSNCYYGPAQVTTATYCVYQEPSGTKVASISQEPGYSYNVSLNVSYAGLNASAYLTQYNPESELESAGIAYGNASAGNEIYASAPNPQGSMIVSSNGTFFIANSTDYSEYANAYEQLVNTMSYYNNTGDSGDTSSASEAMYSYENALGSFIGDLGPANSSLCSVSNNGAIYKCKPYSQFQFYNMSAALNSYNGTPKTLSYMGSSIKIS